MNDIEMLGELWKRRVEWLWEMCEVTAGKKIDLEWLDEQIIKDEINAGKAPQG